MKPIVRWPVGNVSKMGIRCLDASVRHFKHLYGNLFDYYICYNQIDFRKICFLEKYKLNFLNQDNYLKSLKKPPIKKHPCWKLYPPRIGKNSHEIFIDNDLIIYKKNPLLEDFLQQKDFFIISEGYKRSYGIYSNKIRKNFVINTGIFGLPPNYDFASDLNESLPNFWTSSSACVEEDLLKEGHFDEQGLVAYIIQNKKVKIIDRETINVAVYENKHKKGICGTHYVGINKIKRIMFQ